MAKANVPFLEGLPRLQHLSLTSPPWKLPNRPDVGWHALWGWAARHPSLHRLDLPPEFCENAGTIKPEVLNAVAQLLAETRSVCVQCLMDLKSFREMDAHFRSQLLAEWA
ncbi:hypothetical protein ABPG75_010254 [Micractinium tetrahymenae]